MTDTLLLDNLLWDLALDTSGNIAVASDPYARAQDAASALRLFAGELYYNTDAGVPYFERVLGQTPPVSLLKSYMVDAAESVVGVASAQAYIRSWDGRVVRGQVQITDQDGNTSAAEF